MRQESTLTLISNYGAFDLYPMREANSLRPHKIDTRLSTYWLEYYVEYTNSTKQFVFYAGLRASWNCATDGFPTIGNLQSWARKHNALLATGVADLQVHSVALRRVENGEVVAKWTT